MREYAYYTQVLKDQLIPATGCTEPIALAYGAAIAYRTLGAEPERITAAVSGRVMTSGRPATTAPSIQNRLRSSAGVMPRER